MALELPRRRFLAGLVGLIAAPAIVKVANLMPIKSIEDRFEAYTSYFRQENALVPKDWRYVERISIPQATWRMYNQGVAYETAGLLSEQNDIFSELEFARC